MKTTISYAAALSVLAVMALLSTAAADSITINVAFDLADVQLGTRTGGDGAAYTTVSLAGCHETTMEEGKPELPAKTLRILLPPGANLDGAVGGAKACRSRAARSTAPRCIPSSPRSCFGSTTHSQPGSRRIRRPIRAARRIPACG